MPRTTNHVSQYVSTLFIRRHPSDIILTLVYETIPLGKLLIADIQREHVK